MGRPDDRGNRHVTYLGRQQGPGGVADERSKYRVDQKGWQMRRGLTTQ